MALTATASQGMEPVRLTSAEEIMYLPGDPGVTYTRGDSVYMNGSWGTATAGVEGLLQVTPADGTVQIGTVTRTTVCPANTQAFPGPGLHNPIEWAAEDKTLVPVKVSVAAGVQVYKCTFASHKDDTVVTYSASSRYIEETTGHGTDDYPNGALVYVYEGPGAGEINVVDDYDHTGGATELLLQLHRPFVATLTSASKIIVLTGEAAANRGISLFGRIAQKDVNELDAADGANDGKWVVFADFLRIPYYLKNLWLPVIKASDIYVS